jgi:hypothetical protein
MNSKLVLYSRADCCLCEEMKDAIRQVAAKIPLDLEEIDVDSSTQLKERLGDEVPVLFIDGRKAFKYKVAAKEWRNASAGAGFGRGWV